VWHYSIQAGREKELQKLLLLIRKTHQFGDARLAGIGWIAGAVRYNATESCPNPSIPFSQNER
jgi:hypothetical protein